MKLHEYIKGVNKTWKPADGLKDLEHCRLAAVAEVGNIASWHRQRLSYGVPMKIVRPGLKEAYGKLLYNVVKAVELSECEVVVEGRFLDVEIKGVENVDIVGALGAMSEACTIMIQSSFHSEEWPTCLCTLLDLGIVMMAFEGFDVEEIQYASLAQADKEAAA